MKTFFKRKIFHSRKIYQEIENLDLLLLKIYFRLTGVVLVFIVSVCRIIAVGKWTKSDRPQYFYKGEIQLKCPGV